MNELCRKKDQQIQNEKMLSRLKNAQIDKFKILKSDLICSDENLKLENVSNLIKGITLSRTFNFQRKKRSRNFTSIFL